MRYAMAGMVVGVSMFRAATGVACSEPYYTYEIDSFGPDSGQVELNAPLLLTTIENDSEWDPDRSAELDPTLELRVLGSDTPLEVLRPIQLGSTLSFVPSKLEPNTTYSISARLVGDDTVALEGEEVSWELTTGEGIRPPLALTGDWKVTFEAAMDTQYECIMDFGSCGLGDCVAVGEGAVTKARITLPKVVGGFAKELLSGRVELRERGGANNGPADVFDVPGLEPEKAGELVVTMPLIDDKAYVPCFAFTARDARGDHPTSVYCLDEAFPEPVTDVEEPEPMPAPDANPEPVPDAIDEPRDRETTAQPGADNAADGNGPSSSKTSSGCSMSRASHGSGSALGLLLGLAALSRRRQPKSAP